MCLLRPALERNPEFRHAQPLWLAAKENLSVTAEFRITHPSVLTAHAIPHAQILHTRNIAITIAGDLDVVVVARAADVGDCRDGVRGSAVVGFDFGAGHARAAAGRVSNLAKDCLADGDFAGVAAEGEGGGWKGEKGGERDEGRDELHGGGSRFCCWDGFDKVVANVKSGGDSLI
ncbi:hypothetical protein O988_07756 [Pseudogymnoascus sp. VKM F-3808]|nr:hypothetical protein O988_07756 [Pseudogymnoascus sp. VKM F-3808]